MKTIEKSEPTKIYVAKDGKEFKDEHECAEYEARCAREEQIKSIDHLLYSRNDMATPLPIGATDADECVAYRWYKVKSKDDIELFMNVFSPIRSQIIVSQFPAYIYVESHDELFNNVYYEVLDESINQIQTFLKFFNMRVEIKQEMQD